MRPAEFDAKMRALGWMLERIGSKGHHVYRFATTGARLTLDADNPSYCAAYLKKYAQRDQRRARKQRTCVQRY